MERRRSKRLKTYIGAKISFNSSYCIIDCLVRDLSQNGAKLVLSETAILPNHFDLIMPQKGLKLRVELMWRDSNRIGVAFIDRSHV